MKKLGYMDLLNAAKKEVRSLSVDEAESLAAKGDAVLVDIRDPRELEREGLIEGSRHAPRGMLEFWIDPESPYHKPWFAEDRLYVFYCAGGGRSLLAAQVAQRMGLKAVDMKGGVKAWRESGKPVVGRKDG